MGLLDETIAAIGPLDQGAMDRARERWQKLYLGMGRLGSMEDMVIQYAGVTGSEEVELPKRCMVIASADHGVARHNISAYPVSTTVGMTRNYLVSKGAGANAMAAYCNADMVVVDMGIAHDMSDVPGLLDRKIAWGTDDFPRAGHEPGGCHPRRGDRHRDRRGEGARRLPGVPRGGNGHLQYGVRGVHHRRLQSLERAGGDRPGTNISDERLRRKIELVQQALDVNQPNPDDGLDVLAKVGGFEFGCLVGVMLGAAANHAITVIDGFNTTACAFIARALAPGRCIISWRRTGPGSRHTRSRWRRWACLNMWIWDSGWARPPARRSR